MILQISELDTIIYAIENRILDDAPAAAARTPVSLKVNGNGVLISLSDALGFPIISLNIFSWISAPNAATASYEVTFMRVIT